MLLKSTYVVGIAFAVSIFAVTLFTGSEEIRSECVCDSSTPAEALEEAGAVFMGVVVEKGRAQQFFSCDGPNLKVDPPVSSGGSYPVKLQVSTVWKGRVRETMIVTAGGGCGYEFSPGVEYLVYTRGSFVSVCGATVRASKAHEHFKVLGRGSTPEPGTFGSMRTSSRTPPNVSDGDANDYADADDNTGPDAHSDKHSDVTATADLHRVVQHPRRI